MKIAVIILIILAAYIGYEFVRIRGLIQVGEGLGEHEKPFERVEGKVSILVLGDSTAVGLGTTDPQYSVAGRLSEMLDASVENLAVSGETTAQTAAQFAKAKRDHYDLILIQIGANDIIRFHSPRAAGEQLDALLKAVSKRSDRIVLLTGGKIGEAPFFPHPFGFLWNSGAARLRSYFIATAANDHVAYVDLYTIPDPFATDPAKYYAADGLHLSDDGYAFWYEQVKNTIEAQWPELVAHG